MALANTGSLSTDLNVDPYYDDFDETKNFHRMLFRPGLAVQARELTQMQTMLQNQIDRFGEHVFKEGSVVKGCEVKYDRDQIRYIKIRDNDNNGTSVDATAFIGSTITGTTSGITAHVIDALDGSEANTPNTKTLYVYYTSGGSNNTTTAVLSGERLTSNTSLSANVVTEGAQSTNVVGNAARMELGAGIMFAKDHFINVSAANTIIGRYSSNNTIRVGYDVLETIVTQASDTTLQDPAQGSFNYAAPGSDRLKLNPVITTRTVSDTNDKNFIERVRITNGNIELRTDKPVYAVIDDYIARRTFDESGDYLVRGLTTRPREHLNSANNGGVFTLANGGDSNKLSIDVAPGKAYVKGFEIDKFISTHVAVDKGTDAEQVENSTVPANYGNYITVDNVVGTWDVNGHDRVDLYNLKQNAVANNTFSAQAPRGTKIGEARVRAIEYSSGTKGDAGGVYNLYLYDVAMTANNFSNVKSVHFDNSTFDGFADIKGTALVDTEFNKGLFNIGAGATKTIRDAADAIDNDFRFLKTEDVTIAADGTFTITTGGAGNEEWAFSTGALSSAQERDNFYVVMRATANSATARDTTAARAANSNTVTGLTSVTTKYNVGDKIQLQGESNTYVISNLNSATSVNYYGPGEGGALSGATVFKFFTPGQVISLNGVGGDGTARSVNIASATSATVDIQETLSGTVAATVISEQKKVNGQEIAKVINKGRFVELNISDGFSTHGLTGPWPLGLSDGHKLQEVRLKTGNTFFAATSDGTDVTSDFELDSGMTDNLYDHAKLKLKSTSSRSIANGDVYLVKMDFFTHDTSSGIGYFSVDSYPIDDVNGSANTNAITTQEIPVFTSKVSGTRYDLRDQIDIRPRITDTANSVTSLTNISRNPATSTVIVEPSGGLRYMPPNEDFTADFQYYLSRIDRVVLTAKGTFRVIKGTPAQKPVTPPEPSDGMTVAIIDVKPYPSLPQETANRVSTATAKGRPDLSIKVRGKRIRRYTMRDILGLEERIDNLEYYTSLSLLEAETKNTFLADSSGADRFKNGIVVDQFSDFVGSDFNDPDYRAAINDTDQEARAQFKLDEAQLSFRSANSTNVTAKSKDVRLTLSTSGTYSNGETVTQGAASGTLLYQVGDRLYLENVSGTFTTGGGNVTGGTSSTARALSAVKIPDDGKIITLPYTQDAVQIQDTASDTRNTAGSLFFYEGFMSLSPQTDFFQDVTQAPEVNIDLGQFADAFVALNNFIGGRLDTSIDRQIAGGSFGLRTFENITTRLQVQAGQTLEQDLGGVVDVGIIPFMRSRVIQVNVNGLKPSTRHFAFFDDTDVNSFVSQANSSFANTKAEGTALVSDSNGDLFFNYRLPQNDQVRFTNGDKVLRVSDNAQNSEDFGSVTSAASAVYSATGLDVTTRRGIVSTRSGFNLAAVPERTEFQIFTPPPRRHDPVAQSFFVDDVDNINTPGMFLTKIDLFFSSKDSSKGLTVEIREMDPSLSFITEKVVPFSQVSVPSADINTSTDASSPTPIVFETPVYLVSGFQYAIVLKPHENNQNTVVYISRLGETDLVTGNRIVTQPADGNLFISSNDQTYTPIIGENIKYKLYFANFGTNQTGTAVFKNLDREYLTLSARDGAFDRVGEEVHGPTSLVFTTQPSANANFTIRGNTSAANGTVVSTTANTSVLKEVTTAAKFTTGETVRVMFANGSPTQTTAVITSQSTPTGKVLHFDSVTQSNTFLHLSEPSGSFAAADSIRAQISGLDATIGSVDNLPGDNFTTFASNFALQDTTLDMTAKLNTSASARDTAFRKVNINNPTVLENRRFVLSRSNEIANISSQKSAEIQAVLKNTANVRHSPGIDNDRSALFIAENLINNDSTGEDGTSGGNALARYITKTINLAEGQDAEDLKVFLAAYRPATANIKVYYKILHAEDGDTLDDTSYVEMTQATSTTVVSDPENREDFKEYEFTIPTAQKTGASDEVQYVNSSGVTFTGFKHFKIKVVMLSTSSSNIPRIRDFRAIALQI